MKSGHQLKKIQEFKPDTLETLRNELSVTTAEEFLHFSGHYRGELAQLLDVKPETVDRFADAAASVVDDEEVAAIVGEPEDTYPYRTGHDAPSDPDGTFRQE